MTILVVVPAAVHIFSNTITERVEGGVEIDPGETVYRKVSDNKYYLADADTEASSENCAISVGYCSSDGDFFMIATGGYIDFGVNLKKGEIYCQSLTAGKLQPAVDFTGTGAYTVIYGIAIAARIFDIQIHAPGIQRIGTGW